METMQDYQLYESGKNYNRKLKPDYYKTIDINEKFDNNDHWNGVQANGQPTLIFPVYSRTADFEIASILSSPIKAKFSMENESDKNQNDEIQQKIDILNHAIEWKWEKDKIENMLRDLLRDGFNSGDYCVYTYWDKDINTKQTHGINPQTMKPAPIMGDFCNEIKDGSEIFFGNPNDRRVQPQPYILIAGRDLVSKLREEAKKNGIPKDEYIQITGDSDTEDRSGDRGKIELDSQDISTQKCSYVIKMWKENGHVWFRKSTKSSRVIKAQDMGLKRYPIAWGNWKKRKNSYHGMAPGTALVPNQIAINQMYSMMVFFMKQTAFGKVVYDKTRIEKWDNRVGGAIPSNGPIDNLVQQLQPGNMNNQMPNILNDMVGKTKELNGASDASLGDVNPEQASGTSIAYTQKANAIPLENPRSLLYDFIEDWVLNMQDFIESKYVVPRQIGYEDNGVKKVGMIKGQDYNEIPLRLKIDVGPSMAWSEITSVNNLNNLLASNRISFLQYLERLPDGFLDDKQGLIEELKAQMEQQAQMQQQQQLMQQQQEQAQGQQMQEQQNMQDQEKMKQYEQMAAFMESLPKETQAKLKALPPDVMEQELMKLMKQSVSQSMK